MLEGLLPNTEHNKVLLDLAFDLATWHTYAKLCLHTTHTIASLRSQTKELGRLLRHYANKLCPQYATKLLPGEEAAAYRRKAASTKKVTKKATKKAAPTPQQPKAPSKAKSAIPKGSGFNLMTYKIHALGDYADHIERFGPTDCFSTQQVHSPLFRSILDSHQFIRVNLSTAELSDFTSEPTRLGLSAKSQNKNEWNATIRST